MLLSAAAENHLRSLVQPGKDAGFKKWMNSLSPERVAEIEENFRRGKVWDDAKATGETIHFGGDVAASYGVIEMPPAEVSNGYAIMLGSWRFPELILPPEMQAAVDRAKEEHVERIKSGAETRVADFFRKEDKS